MTGTRESCGVGLARGQEIRVTINRLICHFVSNLCGCLNNERQKETDRRTQTDTKTQNEHKTYKSEYRT